MTFDEYMQKIERQIFKGNFGKARKIAKKAIRHGWIDQKLSFYANLNFGGLGIYDVIKRVSDTFDEQGFPKVDHSGND